MASIAIDTAGSARKAEPPHRFWTLVEGRAMLELGLLFASRPLMASLPKGDGHAVMVLPGFMASNSSTVPMRNILARLGYDAHGWDSGRNVKIDNALIRRLENQIERLFKASGRTVSLVGWSLGGVLARELAKLHPDKVRLVISLGSPISDDRGHTHAARLFEMLNGKEPEPMQNGRFRGLDEAPPVPTTSIFTKTDGIVHWRGSVQHPDKAAAEQTTENIQVHASHCGLGVNPSVMVAIADRLAQAEGAWQPFAPALIHQWMFPRTSVA
ncbi:MAG: alpha/beta fold hydrolase [Sphingomonadales bacterium]|nr:MAG: alpha/beta fold hydrolase [Sphingomonadales bacterium]